MAIPYPEGTTALATDSEQRALHKILQELNDGGGGSGDAQVFSSASSDPSSDPGVASAIHFRRDNGKVWFWNDTSGAWVLVIGGEA